MLSCPVIIVEATKRTMYISLAKKHGMDLGPPPSLCHTIATFPALALNRGSERALSEKQIRLDTRGEQWKCLFIPIYASLARCMLSDSLV